LNPLDFLVSIGTNFAWDALKAAYRHLTRTSWQDRYPAAVEGAFEEMRDFLARRCEGEPVINSAYIGQAVYAATGLLLDEVFLIEAVDRSFIRAVSKAMLEYDVLILPGANLTDVDRQELAERVISLANLRFKNDLLSNEDAFRQEMLGDAARLSGDVARIEAGLHELLEAFREDRSWEFSAVFLRAAAYARELQTVDENFGVPLVGRTSDLQEVLSRISASTLTILEADGGVGKTRISIEAGRLGKEVDWFFLPQGARFEHSALVWLPRHNPFVVAIDDAHRRDDIVEAVMTVYRFNNAARFLLIMRPGFSEKILSDLPSWSNRSVLTLKPLLRKELGLLLKDKPFEISSDLIRGQVIAMSEGNPQIATMLAKLAKEGEFPVEAKKNDLLRQYARKLLGLTGLDAIDRDLLGVISALGSLDSGSESLIAALCALLGESPISVRGRLLELADRGAILQRGESFVIKPDLISDLVLNESFFIDRPRSRLTYQALYAALSGETRTELLNSLAQCRPDPGSKLDRVLMLITRDLEKFTTSTQPESVIAFCRLVSIIAPAFPDTAVRLVRLAIPLAREIDPSLANQAFGKLVEAASGVMIPELSKGWALLLEVALSISEAADLDSALKAAEEKISKTLELTPIGVSASQDFGAIAWVQDTIRRETESFWRAHRESPAAQTVLASAIKVLFSVGFQVTRSSPEDRFTVQIVSVGMPASPASEKSLSLGVRLVKDVFSQADRPTKLRVLNAATDLLRFTKHGSGLAPVNPEFREMVRKAFDPELLDWLFFITSSDDSPLAVEAAKALVRFGDASLSSVTASFQGSGTQEYMDVFGIEIAHEDWDARTERIEELKAKVGKLLLEADRPELAIECWARWYVEASEVGLSLDLTVVSLALGVLGQENPSALAAVAKFLLASDSFLLEACPDALGKALEDPNVEELVRQLVSSTNTRLNRIAARTLSPYESERATALLEVLSEKANQDVAATIVACFWRSRALHESEADFISHLAERFPSISRQLVSRISVTTETPPHGWGLHFPAAKLKAAKNVVLATARALDLGSAYEINRALSELKKSGNDWVVEWIFARVEFLAASASYVYRGDAVPRELSSSVRALRDSDAWRDTFVDLVRMYERYFDNYSAREALVSLIRWLAIDTDELTHKIVEWVGRGDEAASLAFEILEYNDLWADEVAPFDDLFIQRAAAMLEANDSERIRWRLVYATEPRSFVGSMVPYYEAEIAKWSPLTSRSNERIRQLARLAVSYFEQKKMKAEADELREAEQY
jgi:hypothetical protein